MLGFEERVSNEVGGVKLRDEEVFLYRGSGWGIATIDGDQLVDFDYLHEFPNMNRLELYYKHKLKDGMVIFLCQIFRDRMFIGYDLSCDHGYSQLVQQWSEARFSVEWAMISDDPTPR